MDFNYFWGAWAMGQGVVDLSLGVMQRISLPGLNILPLGESVREAEKCPLEVPSSLVCFKIKT